MKEKTAPDLATEALTPDDQPPPELMTLPELINFTQQQYESFMINPFIKHMTEPEVDSMHRMINPFEPTFSNDLMINPFEGTPKPNTPDTGGLGMVHNKNNRTDSGFKYNQFYVTRVVMIPCIILMVLFSLLLVYIIIRHLRPIMKLYMSVIFYAFSILYFATQIIILLIYDLLNPGKIPNCDGASDQSFISFQLTGIIMPAMAVLVVTVVRVVFLKSPLRWREILTYRNQILGFCVAVLITFTLGFLPLLQLCELDMFNRQCVLLKTWSIKCVGCFVLSLGCGLLAPKVAVAIMYYIIYGIIRKAREVNRQLSTRSTIPSKKTDTKTLATSSSSESEDTESAKEKRMRTERESFPWSIVVILLLNIVSAVPWVVLVGAPELVYKKRDTKTFFILDILYSLLLIATAASPIAYLLTTKVVRDTTLNTLRKCFKRICPC